MSSATSGHFSHDIINNYFRHGDARVMGQPSLPFASNKSGAILFSFDGA
jgi:hypothetical protein